MMADPMLSISESGTVEFVLFPVTVHAVVVTVIHIRRSFVKKATSMVTGTNHGFTAESPERKCRGMLYMPVQSSFSALTELVEFTICVRDAALWNIWKL